MYMSFEQKFPELFQFFGAYFPDADFEGISDEEVVARYVSDCLKSEVSTKGLAEAKSELNSLLSCVDEYWDEVSREANRYFESPYQALEWLKMVKSNLNL